MKPRSLLFGTISLLAFSACTTRNANSTQPSEQEASTAASTSDGIKLEMDADGIADESSLGKFDLAFQCSEIINQRLDLTKSGYNDINALRFSELAVVLSYQMARGIEYFANTNRLTRAQKVIDKTSNTEVYILSNDKDIVVSFRGTQPKHMKDLVTDGLLFRTNATWGGVHNGFNGAYKTIQDKLFKALVKHGLSAPFLSQGSTGTYANIAAGLGTPTQKKLHIVGHSLGGALATLFAADLAQRQIAYHYQKNGGEKSITAHLLAPDADAFKKDANLKVLGNCTMLSNDAKPEFVSAIYTFGSPRVGDNAFAQCFDAVYKGRTFRMVHNNDMVAGMPKVGFQHVNTLYYLKGDGGMSINPSGMELAWDRGIGLIPNNQYAGDHLNYHLAIARNINPKCPKP